VHFPVHQEFSFQIHKKTSRQAVPADLWVYAHHFNNLRVQEAIPVDEDGDLNKIMNVPFPFKPRKIVVPRRGKLRREQVIDEGETPRKSAREINHSWNQDIFGKLNEGSVTI